MNAEPTPAFAEPQESHGPHGGREPLSIYTPPSPAGRPPARPARSERKGFHLGLKAKLIAPTVGVLLFSFAAIYLAVQHEAKVLALSRLTGLASAARSVQDKIDRCLFERYGDVQAFGLNREFHRDLTKLTEPERAGVVGLLNDYVKNYGCYALSIITDASGKIVAVNSRDGTGAELPNASRLLGRSLADTEAFRNAAAGKFTTYNGSDALTGTFAGGPEKNSLVTEAYGDKAPNWVVSFTAPIRDSRAGDIRGYCQNLFDCAMLEKIVLAEYGEQKKQGLPSTELNVIDAAGRLIVDVDPTETGNNEVRTTDLLKNNFYEAGEDIAVVARKSAATDGTASGKNVRMSKAAGHDFVQPGGFARSTPTLGYAGSGFTTLVRAEPRELFATIDALKLSTQIIAISGLSLGMLAVWLVSRRVVSGIVGVRDAITGLSQGDIRHDIAVRSNDEVGAMSFAFNKARQGLRKTFGQDQIDWTAVAELKVRADIINLTSIVSESDLKGNILNINEKFIELSQYSREELIGHPHNTTRHPDMPKETFKQLWATIGRGKTFRGVIKNRKKDGTPYYVDAVVAPVLGDDGKPKKYIGVRYDITAVEIERQNMKGLLGAINSSYAYIDFDTKGNVLSANSNFQQLLGYKSDEIVGRHHRMFVEPAFANSTAYAQFWTDLSAGKSFSDVFKRITKDGREVWVQAVYAPVKDEMDRVFKVVKIATDVTDRKLAEAKLQTTMAAVSQNASSLGSASEELTANSQQMVNNAEETAAQAGVVSAAAEQVSKNVQTVATGTEEMSASIKEIAKNAHDAAKVATTAVEAAMTTNATITKLGLSSAEIGKVIEVITSIAQQTNLLALNATIEAARAGEAGKGFAVVANEVKELAKETAKATEDISKQIETIQADTKSAVAAISEISTVIGKISDYQNTIASAVEEQTATTNEIARNVAEAAKGSTEIAQNITGVAQAAKSTMAGANDTQKASAELSRMAADLQRLAS